MKVYVDQFIYRIFYPAIERRKVTSYLQKSLLLGSFSLNHSSSFSHCSIGNIVLMKHKKHSLRCAKSETGNQLTIEVSHGGQVHFIASVADRDLSYPLTVIFENVGRLDSFLRGPESCWQVEEAEKFLCLSVVVEDYLEVTLRIRLEAEGDFESILETALDDESCFLEDLQRQAKEAVEEHEAQMSLLRTEQIQSIRASELNGTAKGELERTIEGLKEEIDGLKEEILSLESRQKTVEMVLREGREEKVFSKNSKVNPKPREGEEFQRYKEALLHQFRSSQSPRMMEIYATGLNFRQHFVDICEASISQSKFLELYPNLKEVYLSKNKISRIEGLENHLNLLKLDLSVNAVQRIEGLRNNVQLRELILHTNCIPKMEGVFHLRALEILSLSNNRIEEVPEGVSGLRSVREIRLINNRVRYLSGKLNDLKELKAFSIIGNVCFGEKNKSKEVIGRLLERGVFTACSNF